LIVELAEGVQSALRIVLFHDAILGFYLAVLEKRGHEETAFVVAGGQGTSDSGVKLRLGCWLLLEDVFTLRDSRDHLIKAMLYSSMFLVSLVQLLMKALILRNGGILRAEDGPRDP
jgi:hypothetical protein